MEPWEPLQLAQPELSTGDREIVVNSFLPTPHCPLCDSEPQLLEAVWGEAVWGDSVPICVPLSDIAPNWEISRNVKEIR